MATPTTTRPVVFFDLALSGEPLGRVKLQLFADKVPRTAENFRQFCTGESLDSTRKPQGYKNTKFFRVIPGFMMQGGDFVKGDGTGSVCIHGDTIRFDDEPEGLKLKHDAEGLLSMANSGPNTNGCQFFITFAPAPHLNGKHVVFGKVVEGMDVVKMVERVRLRGERPVNDVVVTQCGEM